MENKWSSVATRELRWIYISHKMTESCSSAKTFLQDLNGIVKLHDRDSLATVAPRSQMRKPAEILIDIDRTEQKVRLLVELYAFSISCGMRTQSSSREFWTLRKVEDLCSRETDHNAWGERFQVLAKAGRAIRTRLTNAVECRLETLSLTLTWSWSQ